MQEENLREHGIHPRYLHALVNMPIMFGPMALLSAFHFIRLSIVRVGGGSKHQHVAPPTRRRSTKRKRKSSCGLPLALGTMRLTLGACVITPLVILSCAPHQEPRFLLPLLPVLALLISGDLAILHSRYFLVGVYSLLPQPSHYPTPFLSWRGYCGISRALYSLAYSNKGASYRRYSISAIIVRARLKEAISSSFTPICRHAIC